MHIQMSSRLKSDGGFSYFQQGPMRATVDERVRTDRRPMKSRLKF